MRSDWQFLASLAAQAAFARYTATNGLQERAGLYSRHRGMEATRLLLQIPQARSEQDLLELQDRAREAGNPAALAALDAALDASDQAIENPDAVIQVRFGEHALGTENRPPFSYEMTFGSPGRSDAMTLQTGSMKRASEVRDVLDWCEIVDPNSPYGASRPMRFSGRSPRPYMSDEEIGSLVAWSYRFVVLDAGGDRSARLLHRDQLRAPKPVVEEPPTPRLV